MIQQHFDGMHDFAASVFGQCSTATRTDRLRTEFFRDLLNREEQHREVGMVAGNLSCGLQAVHVRHRKIENYDIRVKLLGFFDRFLAITSVGAHSPATVGFDQPAEQTADCSVVIGDENSDCHWIHENLQV